MWWPRVRDTTIEQLTRYDWIVLSPWDDTATVSAIHTKHPGEVVLNAANACEVGWAASLPATDSKNADFMPIPTAWMLTQVGATLTASVTASTSTMRVSATRATGAGGAIDLFVPGDVVVIGTELAEVSAVDHSDKTLTLRRGVVKAATAHNAGDRVAATIAFWPGSLMMDVTAACPRVTVDPAVGPETWTDYNARLGARLVAGTSFDALLIDRADGDESWLIGNSSARSIDGSRTNVVSASYDRFDSAWNAGIRGYELRLRSLLPTTPLFGNWAYPNYDILNGNNFEGFPNARTSQYPWDSTVIGPWPQHGSYFEWLAKARQPNLTTIETYEDDGGADPTGDGTYDNPAARPGFEPNYRKMRFGLATALMGDGFFSYEINTNGHGSLGLLWFDEYDGAGRGRGFLGTPIESGSRVAETPAAAPDLLRGDGAFDTTAEASTWHFEVDAGPSASASREGSAAYSGASGLRVTVASPSAADWRVAQSHAVRVETSRDYTLSFWARADRPRQVHAWVQHSRAPWTDSADFESAALTTSWTHFVLTARSSRSDQTALLRLAFGDTAGSVYIDNVRLQLGSPDLWRRRFTGGAVVLNATSSTSTISLGGLYRELMGTQVPAANTGVLTSAVTLGPGDGRLVASVDTTRIASAMVSAVADWTRTSRLARAAATHFEPLAKRGSPAQRGEASRARAAWDSASRRAAEAGVACLISRDLLILHPETAADSVSAAVSSSRAARFAAESAAVLPGASTARGARSSAVAADVSVAAVYVSAR